VSASYLWSSLARVDVVSAPPSASLVFYGPSSTRVLGLPLLAPGQEVEVDWGAAVGGYDSDGDEGGDADDSVRIPAARDSEQGRPSEPGGSSGSRFLDGGASVAARGGLVPHSVTIPAPDLPTSSCLADVAVSGLPGWVGLYAPFARQPLQLRVWAPRGVEVFLRPPLPCPPPPKPVSSAAAGADQGGEGGGGAAAARGGEVDALDLADISRALDGSEREWETARCVLLAGGLCALCSCCR
jgi:nitric-oxide synthase